VEVSGRCLGLEDTLEEKSLQVRAAEVATPQYLKASGLGFFRRGFKVQGQMRVQVGQEPLGTSCSLGLGPGAPDGSQMSWRVCSEGTTVSQVALMRPSDHGPPTNQP
jgi:hypothetical protein